MHPNLKSSVLITEILLKLEAYLKLQRFSSLGRNKKKNAVLCSHITGRAFHLFHVASVL
jgi:hypothetical protein